MKSALYVGRVAHARFGAKRHKLRYRIFMLALDLDELPSLSLRTLSHNGANLYAVNNRDHCACTDAPLRPQIERKLTDAGIRTPGGRIVLLTMPRVLGYVFNPLSVYFCYDPSETLRAIVYEVSNTFGERHDYVLPVREEASGSVEQKCAKTFFVSPFLDMDLGYEFTIEEPGERVLIAMKVKRGEEVVLTASFSGERRPLSDANLLREFAIDPLMTFKAIAGIHWEAFKMWLKGVPYIGRGASAKAPRGSRA
ncbi:MAG TPA: DUF1365 family protein [Caulobacterales bacterium]|nr:DUF1365 family protein [Caulobacterales bacterium]